MTAKGRIQGRRLSKVFFIFAGTVIFGGSLLFAVEQKGDSGLERYRIFALKHISAEQGKKYLADAGIGTVSQLPPPNTILVTALPADLVKATALLQLVDTKELFCVRAIFPASQAKDLPANKQIESAVGDISIGTFNEPPAGDAPAKAIIDVHADKVIAVLPLKQLEKVVSAIETLLVKKTEETLQPPEPNKSDELFNGLLGTLAETEKKVATQTVRRLSRPNEPNVAAALPQQEVLTKPLQKEERAAKPLQEPNLVLARGPQTEDLIGKPKPKPELVPAEEQAAIKTERPAEANMPAPKARPYEPEPVPMGDETLELSLPERLDVVLLVDLVGKYLHLDYMYDPDKIKGEVKLTLQGPIKVKELYPLLESVLKFRGFAMTRKGNLVTIAPFENALDIDPVLLPADKDKVQYGDVVVTKFFNLQYIDTTSAKNLLDSMKLGANITPIPETATLIITGYTYRMARIEELLSIIDKPGEPKQFRYRALKYTMASALAPKIKTLVEQLGDMSVTIATPVSPAAPRGGRRPAPAQARPAGPEAGKPTVYLDADERTNRVLMIGFEAQLAVVDELINALDVEKQDLRTMRLYEIQHVGAEEVRAKLSELGIIGGGIGRAGAMTITPRAEAPPRVGAAAATEGIMEEPQVIVIDSINALLVNATPEQHIQVSTIISYVDTETLEQAIPYEIYTLENQDPKTLAEVLTKLIQETIKDKEGKIEKVVRKEEDIIIVPDESTFSIIVYASRKNHEWIRKLIKSLDKRRPQVLIDVTLVEIRSNDSFNYDLMMIESFPDLTSTSGLTNTIVPATSTAAAVTSDTILSKLSTAKRDRFIDARVASGSATGFYGDEHINALLTIVQKKGYGRVLAKPKILVNDNETGTISTTDTRYIPETSSIISGTGTGQENTVYKAYDAKIQLDITPHISEGDLLRLEVGLVRQDFLKTASATGAPPNQSSSDVKTIVTVPDRKTIILGGLIKLDQTKGGTKVPLLGDIPIIGTLFRNISNEQTESKLYVFVKANILRPEKDIAGLPELEEISNRNRTAFEHGEEKFQKHQDFPGVTPEPMDPLKVLEEM